MAAGTLFTYPDNFKAFKALIAAEYSGAKVQVVSTPPDFILGETNATKEFLDKFPLGKLPAFESKDGKFLNCANAISILLANDQLRGSGVEAKTEIQQWISFADNEILPPACTWVFPCMGIMGFNKQANERAKADLKAALGILDAHLKTRTFLVGERLTLADICCMCNLILPFKWVLDPESRSGFNNVTRWFLTVANQPQAKSVIGDMTLCSKAASFDAKAFAEFSKGGKAKQRATSGRHSESSATELTYEYDIKSKERTFIMVKPDGVQRGLVGEIIDRFETRGGLKLVAMKFMQASVEHMKLHYADLASKPFFNGMVEYMASSPVVPMVWEGLNASKIGRMLLGETDPQKSLPGSIRGDFCLDIGRNLIHGSDSPDSAKKEIELWFGADLTEWTPGNQFFNYEPSKIVKGKAEKAGAPKKEKKDAPKKEKKEEKEKSNTEKQIAEAMEEEPAPKKDKDPFAGFPKSSFILDEFKRVYSNEDIKTKAIPYFWENFDKENFSIWMCEYQYPEDLGMTFQSENLITGMYQRLDKLNKNAFASVGLFGKSRNSQIQGIWVWRGSELAFKLSDNWQIDYESYDWTRLDPTSSDTQAIVNEFLLHEEDVMAYKPHKPEVYDKYKGLTLYSANVFK